MLTRRLIPCLDVRDGRIVKGVRFSNLRDAGDPVERAILYEHDGADEIVILDVSATREGRRAALGVVRDVREAISIPITVGGGVREPAHAEDLLRAGADKVGINTAAVERPGILGELSGRVGTQCVVMALDAASHRGPGADGLPSWEVVTHAGSRRTGIDAVDMAREAERRGAGEILLTSWDRDGSGAGYDLDLLAAIRAAIDLPIVASGGAASPEHMRKALDAGADAVLAASIFHDSRMSVGEVKAALRDGGVEVRP